MSRLSVAGSRLSVVSVVSCQLSVVVSGQSSREPSRYLLGLVKGHNARVHDERGLLSTSVLKAPQPPQETLEEAVDRHPFRGQADRRSRRLRTEGSKGSEAAKGIL